MPERDALAGEPRLQTAILESLGTPVFVARPPGVLTFMNKAAREITGLDSMVGHSLDEVHSVFTARDPATDELLPRSALLAALSGAASEGDSIFKNVKTGEEHEVHFIVRAVRDDQGKVVAAVSTLHDLTELRKVEHEKEQFLSIVSHELRTPLTPLKALAQLLMTRLRRSRSGTQPLDVDSLERNLALIERQVDRMNGLVTDLLSVSRAGRGKLDIARSPFDLAASVRETVEKYVVATREEGRHTFVVDAPGTLMVNADQARIEQTLMNLVGNAVKYSPRGGEVHVTLTARDGAAVVAITDQGIGVSAADLPRLGGAFVRGSGKAGTFAGMGIGLHVARLMAEAHGGSLKLESDGEDRGTTVRMSLPV
jgi:PAS domain S-box-containing protein